MKPLIKRARNARGLLDTIMFMLYFLLLAYLAFSPTLSGAPRYVNGRWVTDLENPDYYDAEDDDNNNNNDDDDGDDNIDDDDDDSPLVEENMLPDNISTTPESLQTTPVSDLLGEDPNEMHDSKVWKIVLVTAILLMFVMGSLGTAYYLCIWRGGRIHYQPQKTYA